MTTTTPMDAHPFRGRAARRRASPRCRPRPRALNEVRITRKGTSPRGLLASIQLDEPDAGVGWSVRVTANLDDEEVLGLLVGYVEHLKQEAAASWDDTDPTRAGE